MKSILPAGAPLNVVGGTGMEFYYDGANHPYVTAPYGDQIAGKCRVEVAAPLTADSYFLNVFYAATDAATSMPDVQLVSETADSVTVAVNDGQTLITFSKTGALAYSISSGGPVQITTTALAGATQGQAYSAQVQTAGGMLPFAWSVAGGALPDGLALNATSGVISGTPTAAGTFNFTVQVVDSDTPATNDTQALSITVSAVNQAPTMSGVPDVLTDEDTPVNDAIDLWAYADDAETPDAALSFSIVSVSNPGAGVTLDSNRYIDVNPASDWSGTATVIVEVSDGSLTAQDTFTVTVNGLNDPPIVMPLPDVVTNEDTPVAQAIDLWAYAGDAETPDNLLVFSIDSVTDPSAGVTITGNRYVSVSPAAQWSGSAVVTISVSDGLAATRWLLQRHGQRR